MRAATIFACCTVVTLCGRTLDAAPLTWGAGLLNGQLVVVVDTSASPPNLVVDDASFNATYVDGQGRTLGTQYVALPAREIVGRSRHSFSVAPKYPAATRVTTDSLFASWHAEGLKNDGEEIAGNAAVASTLTPGQARVIPPPASLASRCDDYARRAVSQNSRNLAMKCGYGDTRWSNDFNLHKQWCQARPEAEPEQETVTRDGLLRACVRRRVQSSIGPLDR